MKERGSLNRRIEDIKDNHIEILDLKNTISKMKALGDELKSIIEGREERNSEFKDRTIEMIQSEQQKKQTKRKKKIRTSGNCGGSLTKDLTFVSLESQERRKMTRMKDYQRNNG